MPFPQPFSPVILMHCFPPVCAAACMYHLQDRKSIPSNDKHPVLLLLPSPCVPYSPFSPLVLSVHSILAWPTHGHSQEPRQLVKARDCRTRHSGHTHAQPPRGARADSRVQCANRRAFRQSERQTQPYNCCSWWVREMREGRQVRAIEGGKGGEREMSEK